ncbi:hypothetical protein LIER_03168 [Lithospermum erythrorhizon]|uniref:RNase H type-1 domain-containing protein n=1 Tax=Lithospermum erythrorhizon TaxID=34254 RepID=A0AAV3NSN5_LITER
MGAIARNEQGAFCAAQFQSYACTQSVLVAEKLACRAGLEMTLRNNLSQIFINIRGYWMLNSSLLDVHPTMWHIMFHIGIMGRRVSLIGNLRHPSGWKQPSHEI